MDYREIPLTKGKVAKVSPEDYEELSQYKWSASYHGRKHHEKWYAVRRVKKGEPGFVSGKPKVIRMHRQILGLRDAKTDPIIVDHVNADGLNNTRENLEMLGSQHENMLRTCGWARKKEEPFL